MKNSKRVVSTEETRVGVQLMLKSYASFGTSYITRHEARLLLVPQPPHESDEYAVTSCVTGAGFCGGHIRWAEVHGTC
jgi:hypothetical protein